MTGERRSGTGSWISTALVVLVAASAIVRAADGNRVWPFDGVPVVEDSAASEHDR